jgi:peroxiredoxin
MTGLGRKVLSSLFLLIAIVGAVSACDGKTLSDLFQEARIAPIQKPKAAHDFVLPDVHGKECRLKDLRGKIVILNIWAMWCAPCREEMPSIERLHQHFKGQDLIVLAVSIDMADSELVKAFADENQFTFTILHDPRGNIMKWFGVRLIPVTYLIDKSGKVIGKTVGLRDWGHENMIQLLEELLKRSEKEP